MPKLLERVKSFFGRRKKGTKVQTEEPKVETNQEEPNRGQEKQEPSA